MTEPAWLTSARADLGTAEIAGPTANPRIMAYYKAAGADWAADDAVPWCGAAMAAWLSAAGHPPPAEAARARAWLDWGVSLDNPAVGCVVVLKRGSDPASGHVALWIGASDGRTQCLGGNQGDAVSVTGFLTTDVLGYRWPSGAPAPVEPAATVAVPARPLARSGTIWASITGMAAAIGAFFNGAIQTAIEAVAVLQTMTPVKTALIEVGVNSRPVLLGMGVAAGISAIARRVQAADGGVAG